MAAVVVVGVACVGCSGAPAGFPAAAVRAGSGQALVVRPVGPGPVRVEVTAWERRDGRWVVARPAMPGTVGRNGIAAPGDKREGDGKTPAGVYRLGPAFGYALSIETGLDY